MSGDLKNWLGAIGFADECLGGKKGNPQYADLVDGRGEIAEQFLYRQDFHWKFLGSCAETFTGGNHCRGFLQEGSNHWFLGCSVEKDLLTHHTIDTNGYNRGRTDFVNSALKGGKFKDCTWPPATLALLENAGIRSEDGSYYNHGIPVDGEVAVLTVNAPSCKN